MESAATAAAATEQSQRRRHEASRQEAAAVTLLICASRTLATTRVGNAFIQTAAASMDHEESKKSPVQVEYAPVLLEYRLMREFLLLQEQSLSNVYIVPSHASPLSKLSLIHRS